MEPRAQRRKRRAQQGRLLALAGLSAGLLAVGSLAGAFTPTQAMSTAHRDGEAGFRSLSSDDALAMSVSVAALGALTAGAPVKATAVLAVRNTTARTLDVAVSVSGAPGLEAEIRPAVLKPGEVGEVTLTGEVAKTGELRGSIIVTALGGFVRQTVQLRGEVKAPTAVPAVPAPAPDLAPAVPAPGPAPAVPALAPAVPAPGTAPAAPAPAPATPDVLSRS